MERSLQLFPEVMAFTIQMVMAIRFRGPSLDPVSRLPYSPGSSVAHIRFEGPK